MNTLSLLKAATFFTFFLLLYVADRTSVAISKPPYTPTDSILANCGSSGITFSPDGRSWTSDHFNSKFHPIDATNGKSVAATASRQSSNVNTVPYMTARLSQSEFFYSFPVSAGQKFIRLYFYSSSYSSGFDRFQDFFDVKSGPYTLLRNFSVSFHGESQKTTAFVKEFCVNVEENQKLNLTFSPLNDSYAFINGIEILSMPLNLYYTPPDQPLGLSFVGETTTFYVRNDTALEKMYRFNVGGNGISPTGDTGMYRLWEDDTPFVHWDGSANSEPSFSLNYSRIHNYTAPDDVYLSARQMDTDPTDMNITWVLPVDHGFKYLVRLHFCEFATQYGIKVNWRRFNIFLDNQTAKLGFDVLEASGAYLTPIYTDYVITTTERKTEMLVASGDDDYKLFIMLKPNYSSLLNDSFLNGMEIFKLNDSNGNLGGPNPLVSIPPPPPAPVPPVPATKSKSRTLFMAVGISVIIGLLIIISLFVWRLTMRKSFNSSKRESTRSKASSLPEELCRHFSLSEIKAATDNFHKNLIIGTGGFGNVYKGEIDDGTMVVAIKRLNPESRQGTKEFRTEIEMLSQLRHLHLVSLIGYCHEEGEMVLVYEYMINGTLQQHLYETDNDPLPWKKRLEICVGAARGFHYLHSGAKHTIIHRDIKTTNILLDENWVAKVSDFGLSKIGVNDSAVSTMVKGTWGYLDPEYARRHQLTEKSDVYSFGVVLFEVLCARKPLNKKLVEEEQMNLANWARLCIKNGNIHQIIDPYLMGKISPDCFNKFVETAESCVRDNGTERPSMHDVMQKLEFALELQEAADAAEKKKGDDCVSVYPHVSFHASRYSDIDELDSSYNQSGIKDVDTDSSGVTYTSLESGSIMFSHGFSNSNTLSSSETK
ncbi:receptor-like protein kinase FERONIA [Mercurialis annua]|uniref:receptor-like protein kinase FERONIA n=1 Tax=Mercurialis annua TaxID=3986 RepID=UPI00215EC196|nr:receptor-like protein kinase FERONIA [Mercurialis annua]